MHSSASTAHDRTCHTGLGFSKNANAQTLVLLPEHEDESLLTRCAGRGVPSQLIHLWTCDRARQLLQKQAVHLKMKTPSTRAVGSDRG